MGNVLFSLILLFALCSFAKEPEVDGRVYKNSYGLGTTTMFQNPTLCEPKCELSFIGFDSTAHLWRAFFYDTNFKILTGSFSRYLTDSEVENPENFDPTTPAKFNLFATDFSVGTKLYPLGSHMRRWINPYFGISYNLSMIFNVVAGANGGDYSDEFLNQYQNNFYTGHTIKTGIDLRFSETWGMRIEAETVDLSSGSGVSKKLFDQQRYSISILRIGLELDEPPKELKRKLLNDYEGPRRRLGSSLSSESP